MWKVISWVLVCLVLSAGAAGCALWRGSDPLSQKAPAVEYQPVEPETWSLPNGLKVIFLQDPELPVVHGALYFRGGSYWEEPQPTGAAAAMGAQMRQGGAGGFDADELDAELEELAANVSSSAGAEFGSVEFSGLSADSGRIFSLAAKVALEPRFEEGRLELWRAQTLESIRRRTDTPSTPARIAFRELLFGDTPYGRVLTTEQARRISRLDLLRLHRRFVRPDGAILAVSGDITRGRLENLVLENFGAWQPRGSGMPLPPALEFKPRPGIYFIELPFKQATVIMGQQGVERLSHDDTAIKAFNEIFGGSGFSPRLINRIRVQLGLAYVAGGGIFPGLVRGENLIMVQTKDVSAGEALEESLKVLRTMQSEEISAEELEQAKDSIQNSFVFDFDTPEKVVERRAILELLGYPPDYDAEFIPKVLALTPSDIKEVASHRWNLAEFVIVVVGNKESYQSIRQMSERPEAVLYKIPVRPLHFHEHISSAKR